MSQTTTRNERKCLDTLPEELIISILSWLEVDRDFYAHYNEPNGPHAGARYGQKRGTIASLAAVSLTCKTMHRIAESILYSSLAILSPSTHRNTSAKETQILCSILSTLVARPELAAHLKYVEYMTPRTPIEILKEKNTECLVFAKLPKLYSMISSTAAKIFGAGNLPSWKQALEQNVEYALLGLIIRLAPNLEHLTLPIQRSMPQSIQNLLGPKLTSDFGSLSRLTFSNLRVLCIGAETFTHFDDTLESLLRSFQTLPKLEHLEASLPADHNAEPISDSPLHFESLRTLAFRDIDTNCSFLAKIIDGCPYLESFTCQFTNDDAPWFGDNNMSDDVSLDLSPIYNALHNRRKTLQSISFRLHWIWYSCQVSRFSTFTDFPSLTSLTLDTVSLLGTHWAPGTPFEKPVWDSQMRPAFRICSRLPPTIEVLGILNYHNILDDSVIFHDLADDCKLVPNLRRIVIYTEDRLLLTEHSQVCWPILKARFAKEGVSLVLKECQWGNRFG